MVTLIRKWQKTWHKFRRNNQGVAAVEFALAMPIMLLIYLGSVEAGSLIIMDRKVQTVASSIGDLVSRTNGSLAAKDLRDYFQAASGIMHPFTSDPVKQTVLGVEVTTTNKAIVKWSRQYQNGVLTDKTPYVVGSEVKLPKEVIDLARGRTLIVGDAQYSYRPFYGLIFEQAIGLQRTSFHMPRTTNGVTLVP